MAIQGGRGQVLENERRINFPLSNPRLPFSSITCRASWTSAPRQRIQNDHVGKLVEPGTTGILTSMRTLSDVTCAAPSEFTEAELAKHRHYPGEGCL